MQINGYSHKKRHLFFLMRLSLACLILALMLAVVFVGQATAQQDTDKKINIITLPWDDLAKKPIPPKFVLPKQARWGCLSCHSNKRLTKIREGKEVSLFIDPNIIGKSMHKKIACLDCHTDFSYDVHPATSPQNFRVVAGLACTKCHKFQEYLYRKSIHGKLALQNQKGKIKGREVDPPTCADCHGNHDIQTPRFEPYRSRFRGSVRGGKVCAKCHQDRYQSWNDYYHGRAYKNGAKDAPVCWDCHSNHLIEKKDSPDSTINSAKLPKTCGKCHDRPTDTFTSYAGLIHGRAEIVESNPFVRLVRAVIPIGGGQETTSVVNLKEPREEKPVGLFTRIIRFFFPSSLRPEK